MQRAMRWAMWIGVAALVVAVGCGARPSRGLRRRGFGRERRLVTRYVRSDDGALAVVVEAEGTPTLAPDAARASAYALTVPLPAATTFACRIDPDGGPAAASVQAIVARRARRPDRVDRDAGVVGTHAFLMVDAYDALGDGDVDAASALHVAAVRREPALVTCWLEGGAPSTFRRLLAEVVDSLRLRAPAPAEPAYRQVSTLTGPRADGPGTMRIGFEIVRRESGPGAAIVIDRALLVAAPDGRPSAIDATERQIGDGAGRLDRLVATSLADGVRTRSLTLERVPAGGYRLRGERDGRPVEATFPPGEPLLDATGIARRIAAFASTDVPDLSFRTYEPFAGDDAPASVVVRRRAGSDEGFRFERVAGSRVAYADYDGQGWTTRGESPAPDGTRLGCERILVTGSP